jgi:GNAT superfamily N-acetyltransferase
MLTIVPVKTKAQLIQIRGLFKEYIDSLGFELTFQDYKSELQELPGEYAPPDGQLLLACLENNPIGCVALRRMTDTICELKRMYLKSEYRGRGFGRMLIEAAILEARRIGYQYMRLDTIATMKEATSLYRSMGFQEIPAYRYNPMEGATFMELLLKPPNTNNE